MRGANPNISEVHRAVRTSFVESGIVLELPLSRAEFAIRLLIPRAQERKICENGNPFPLWSLCRRRRAWRCLGDICMESIVNEGIFVPLTLRVLDQDPAAEVLDKGPQLGQVQGDWIEKGKKEQQRAKNCHDVVVVLCGLAQWRDQVEAWSFDGCLGHCTCKSGLLP